ncbi:MAG: SCO6745 family protein [Acidimicrobiales bacterium]
MVDITAAAKLAGRLEPCHAFIYFAPEAGMNYHELGLSGASGYFVSRSAAMGEVTPEVVIATFFNFKPSLVRDAMADAWTTTTPAAVGAARLDAADKALRRMLGEDIDDPDLATAAELARKAAETADPVGRPLFAGHAGLEWPEEPHMVFFHAVTLLREHRGDAHIAALVLHGLDAVEALLTHAASGTLRLPIGLLQATRGWSDEEWAAGEQRLRDRGVLTGDGSFTTEGKALRDRIEEATTASSLQPLEVLGDDGVAQLSELASPFSRTISEATFKF